MESLILILPFFFFFFFFIESILSNPTTTVIFTSNGRSRYAFDIFSLPINPTIAADNELQLTDGHSVNFNGHFVSSFNQTVITNPSLSSNSPSTHLVYVTERNGSSSIYLDVISHGGLDTRKRSVLEEGVTRLQTRLVGGTGGRTSMKDRLSLVGDLLVYVSTHKDTGVERTSWAAVYSTRLSTGLTRRLTPQGVADFSPALSPSGLWTAVASSGERGWGGEVEELDTDVYVFLTQDGSSRVKVVEHGGWPSWVDDSTFYFHRRGLDGWWSVYVAILPKNKQFSVDSVMTRRVTPTCSSLVHPSCFCNQQEYYCSGY